MLFVHISTDEPGEELIEFKKRLQEEDEVWIYYDDKHYFKTRKIVHKTQKRIISKKDMEEIKKSLQKTRITTEEATEEVAEEVTEEVTEEVVEEATE